MADDDAVNILPAVQYFISRGVDPLRVLNAFPRSFFEQQIREGRTPEQIFALAYPVVSCQPKPDRRQRREFVKVERRIRL